MKNALAIAKILFLTIITFGIYGAYWIIVNMNDNTDEPDDPDLSDSEKNALEAKNIFSMAWLQYITKF